MDFKRRLLECDVMAPYAPFVHSCKTRSRFYHGQRKLLMAEIEFLTLCMTEKKLLGITQPTLVLYVGAAQGIHIPYLANMFLDVSFILVDAQPFTLSWDAPSNISIMNFYFDDEKARKFVELYGNTRDILFLSDIRSNTSPVESQEFQEDTQLDMRAQERWHHLIQPRKSMLKFRLLYSQNSDDSHATTSYLAGDLMLPIWGPLSTTECRLVVDRDARDTCYNNQKYEYQMFYHNTVTRYAHVDFPIPSILLDKIYHHNYDDAAEIHVLMQYAMYIKGISDKDEMVRLIIRMHKEITRSLRKPWVYPNKNK